MVEFFPFCFLPPVLVEDVPTHIEIFLVGPSVSASETLGLKGYDRLEMSPSADKWHGLVRGQVMKMSSDRDVRSVSVFCSLSEEQREERHPTNDQVTFGV